MVESKKNKTGRKKKPGRKQKWDVEWFFQFKQGFEFKIQRFKYFQTKFELVPN
jgi:hypothetical protein